MFDRTRIDGLSSVACADALVASVVAQRRLGAERLALAAHWADLHAPVDETEVGDDWTVHRTRTQTRYLPGGSDGTPEISEFAGDELGALLQLTTGSANRLLRDTLDLRHRHPRLWAAVMTGQVDDWKARRVSSATASAGLTREQALDVDRRTAAALVGLPFSRAMDAVAAEVINADPEGYERRRDGEGQRRYVGTGRRSNNHGLRTLIAQTTAGDVARLDAMITHVAQLLLRAGDSASVDHRRATALGLLANPALACLFIAQSAVQADTPHVADEPEPKPETGEQAAEHEAAPPTAPQLAAAFGRVLARLGAKALDGLRPRAVLYLHLAEEALQGGPGCHVVRAEDHGPLSVRQLREWLSTTWGTDHVEVRPVLDPGGITPLDGYEVPSRLREALQLASPFEVFPYGTLASRHADLDHTVPYAGLRARPPDDHPPPGQTRLENLGPLGRGHHRAKTMGGFTLHQPLPGMYLWRTPTGHWFHVDNQGTRPLGRRTPAVLEQLRGRASTVTASRLDTAFAELVLAA